VWPGAMSRAQRNPFIERWAGREWMLRQNAPEIGKHLAAARAAGDIRNASLSFGQDAGRIDSIKEVKEVVDEIVAQAEAILRHRLPSLLSCSERARRAPICRAASAPSPVCPHPPTSGNGRENRSRAARQSRDPSRDRECSPACFSLRLGPRALLRPRPHPP